MEVFDTLARVAEKAGKPDEAKKYAAMVQKLEARDYAEFAKTALGFTPEEFKGRKGKGDRAVLVEVFTGSECAAVRRRSISPPRGCCGRSSRPM